MFCSVCIHAPPMQVKVHPWVTAPLPDGLEAVLTVLRERQAEQQVRKLRKSFALLMA